ncbi:CBS domain-containing protein CBSX1, chloroplastic-like [Zingiber officinale]|uniref:CBS domain-containing protein n=1 Tax=Zingiber officinale TaxID=94328 RepID=A0A8J5ISC5_ZINOF|nr:CBS domain-containing protein CBSX1, chloroplastic-like [Zingiber officinale]XP_042453437.1 CBS domain-containing protein CBSX1, chloroplastic-like [Zingiber officinale]KAG6537983.1 hypothetical protein ZIOFF_003086 [Zingiber officinale]
MLSMELVLVRSPPTLGVNASPSLLPLHSRRPAPFLSPRRQRLFVLRPPAPASLPVALAHNGTVTSQDNGFYTVGDFMTKKEDLHVVKPSTSVDEALELLVENRVTGFPVIDDDWNLVGVVSDYDLLALDSISGSGQTDTSMFPEVDSSWKTFNEIQKLLRKTNGKVIGEVMTDAPLVVRETTNLEDAARLLLETKHRRFPVVDSAGKLVGVITRGNVVSAALQIKHAKRVNS